MPDSPTLLRVLILARHWQKFETFETQFRRAAHELAVAEGESWLASVTVSCRQFERWYAGRVKTEPHPDACRVLEHMFGYTVQELLAPAREGQVPDECPRSDEARTTRRDPPPVGDAIEVVRQGLDDALSEGVMPEASLEDWERSVLRYRCATRDRPASVLVTDLGTDIAELGRVLHRPSFSLSLASANPRCGQLSGLMCLTFCKLDDRRSFRKWARTARLAAEQAGDPLTLSWVLAQESYGHYYSGDLQGALDTARHAQDLVKYIPCVGAALAALEARIHAVMGRSRETRAALARAEHILSLLAGDDLIPSAFALQSGFVRG